MRSLSWLSYKCQCLYICFNPPCNCSVANPVWPVCLAVRERLTAQMSLRTCVHLYRHACRPQKPLTVVLPGGLLPLIAEGTLRRRFTCTASELRLQLWNMPETHKDSSHPPDSVCLKHVCAVLSVCCWLDSVWCVICVGCCSREHVSAVQVSVSLNWVKTNKSGPLKE